MHLRHGGIFNHHFIANFLRSVPAKKLFLNQSIFGKDTGKNTVCPFLTHGVVKH